MGWGPERAVQQGLASTESEPIDGLGLALSGPESDSQLTLSNRFGVRTQKEVTTVTAPKDATGDAYI